MRKERPRCRLPVLRIGRGWDDYERCNVGDLLRMSNAKDKGCVRCVRVIIYQNLSHIIVMSPSGVNVNLGTGHSHFSSDSRHWLQIFSSVAENAFVGLILLRLVARL